MPIFLSIINFSSVSSFHICFNNFFSKSVKAKLESIFSNKCSLKNHIFLSSDLLNI